MPPPSLSSSISRHHQAPAEIEGQALRTSNFLRQVIEKDLATGTYAQRQWGGGPGDAAFHDAGQPDPAKIRTRFPPEPNGYLHVGHAKSICLNFGLARDYGGVCHMRFDDTNPEKEEKEYVDSILDAVQWLGFNWESNFNGKQESHLYYASNYFDFMYRAAEYLITAGHAYVDEQTAEDMRINRGDFGKPGVDSPFRSRSPEENLARFREMRDGKLADGAAVLRAKIDMASPNINLRDPALYRIKRATHHNTGDAWCIYPMYTYAHPLEDALEQITHSICTLEFEDQRPFYDWVLERLVECGLLAQPLPRQYEFARLNLTYIVTSKRKLRQLVEEAIVDGWDDPRLPTLVGMRRRGYTPESLRLLAERSGVSKAMLNQIEGGKSSPSIALGWKIANGLGVPFGALLGEAMPGDFVVHPRDQIQALYSESKELCTRALFPPGDSRAAELYELSLEPGGEEKAQSHLPGTREQIYVTAGHLTVQTGDRDIF